MSLKRRPTVRERPAAPAAVAAPGAPTPVLNLQGVIKTSISTNGMPSKKLITEEARKTVNNAAAKKKTENSAQLTKNVDAQKLQGPNSPKLNLTKKNTSSRASRRAEKKKQIKAEEEKIKKAEEEKIKAVELSKAPELNKTSLQLPKPVVVPVDSHAIVASAIQKASVAGATRKAKKLTQMSNNHTKKISGIDGEIAKIKGNDPNKVLTADETKQIAALQAEKAKAESEFAQKASVIDATRTDKKIAQMANDHKNKISGIDGEIAKIKGNDPNKVLTPNETKQIAELKAEKTKAESEFSEKSKSKNNRKIDATQKAMNEIKKKPQPLSPEDQAQLTKLEDEIKQAQIFKDRKEISRNSKEISENSKNIEDLQKQIDDYKSKAASDPVGYTKLVQKHSAAVAELEKKKTALETKKQSLTEESQIIIKLNNNARKTKKNNKAQKVLNDAQKAQNEAQKQLESNIAGKLDDAQSSLQKEGDINSGTSTEKQKNTNSEPKARAKEREKLQKKYEDTSKRLSADEAKFTKRAAKDQALLEEYQRTGKDKRGIFSRIFGRTIKRNLANAKYARERLIYEEYKFKKTDTQLLEQGKKEQTIREDQRLNTDIRKDKRDEIVSGMAKIALEQGVLDSSSPTYAQDLKNFKKNAQNTANKELDLEEKQAKKQKAVEEQAEKLVADIKRREGKLGLENNTKMANAPIN
jgi:hypothetical protein